MKQAHRPILCNAEAYPFDYDDRRGEHWRVWRPDRVPHHFGRYATEKRAQASADRINTRLKEAIAQTKPQPGLTLGT